MEASDGKTDEAPKGHPSELNEKQQCAYYVCVLEPVLVVGMKTFVAQIHHKDP